VREERKEREERDNSEGTKCVSEDNSLVSV